MGMANKIRFLLIERKMKIAEILGCDYKATFIMQDTGKEI